MGKIKNTDLSPPCTQGQCSRIQPQHMANRNLKCLRECMLLIRIYRHNSEKSHRSPVSEYRWSLTFVPLITFRGHHDEFITCFHFVSFLTIFLLSLSFSRANGFRLLSMCW